MVIDSCHSGTVVDLPYQLIDNKAVRINNNKVPANVICISGSRDNQSAMDIEDAGIYYGSMSNSLYKILVHEPRITWKKLIHMLRKDMNKGRIKQDVQLTVSKSYLINSLVRL